VNANQLSQGNMGHEFPLIEVEGSAYEMGRQHGQKAGDLVRKYLLWIERLTGRPLDLLCGNAMRFQHKIEALSPAYIEEVKGLADGADISFAEALLCQVRAEALCSWEGGCTAFALTGEATASGEVLVGQNQDMEVEFADVAILLKVSPSDGRPRALMFTFAGQLGYSGINQFGVAHFTNALYGFEWQPGLPHYPLKRALLEQKRVQQSLELIQSHPVCSAANMVLADGQGTIADIEIRPEGVALYNDEHHALRLHTNHYQSQRFAACESSFLPDSISRLERIRALVRKAWGSITVDTLKEFMSDHEGNPAGICRHGACNLHSISGYIAEPTKGLLHVRRGHGCLGTWATYKV